jgi:hypothetical protein
VEEAGEQGAGGKGEKKNYLFPLCSQQELPLRLFSMPNNLNILYISTWKSCPLQLKIKMRVVDKTLIST